MPKIQVNIYDISLGTRGIGGNLLSMPVISGIDSGLKAFGKILPRTFLLDCFQNQLFLNSCRNMQHIPDIQLLKITIRKCVYKIETSLVKMQIEMKLNLNIRTQRHTKKWSGTLGELPGRLGFRSEIWRIE